MLDLEQWADKGVAVIQDAVSKVSSSGATAASVRKEMISKDHFQILGRAGFQAIETGRGPRKDNAYGEFDKHLEQWMQHEGFPSKVSKTGVKYFSIGGQWFSAKSMAWKINKEGDHRYRTGAVRDVYSKALAKFVEQMENAIIKDKLQEVKTAVMAPFK